MFFSGYELSEGQCSTCAWAVLIRPDTSGTCHRICQGSVA